MTSLLAVRLWKARGGRLRFGVSLGEMMEDDCDMVSMVGTYVHVLESLYCIYILE
jgi:hypothetical protein